jgi:hypothetical protein
MIRMTIGYMTQAILVSLLLVGCTKNTGETGTDLAEPPPSTKRSTLTRAECEAKGGRIVGDIGDGAIHHPDYTCENGQPPIGNIRPEEGEPIPTEDEVCCPQNP